MAHNRTPARYRPETLTHGPTTACEYREEIAVLLGFERRRYVGALPRKLMVRICHAVTGSPPKKRLTTRDLRKAIGVKLGLPNPDRFETGHAKFRRDDIVTIYDALQDLDPEFISTLADDTICPKCDRPISSTFQRGDSISLDARTLNPGACLCVEDGKLTEYVHKEQ